jgi:hypothetical protein
MKQLFLLLLFAVTFTAGADNLSEIRDVLKFVESEHNPKAVGDDGKAYGIIQIHEIAVDDVNRVYGTNYVHEDAFNIQKSEELFELYIKYWSKKLCEREGRDATTEDIVRIWNGGPKGYKKSSTKWYLRKFLKYRKNLYLCKNEDNSEQTKMFNRWKVRDGDQTVYAYSGYSYLQRA